ncbi:MAG: cyclic nucleotide-binding domain-containing protein [Acidobacteriota bacterium]
MNLTDFTYYWWIVVGVLTAALTLLFIRQSASPEVRGKLRFPVWCVVVTVAATLADAFLSSLAPPALFRHISATGLALALGRLAVLAFFDAGIADRLGLGAERIFRDIIQGIVYAAVALLALSWAGVQITSLLVTSALFTAIIGLALQDTLGNIVAGLTLQVQQPFEVGDWIQLDDGQRAGEVVEINWRAIKIFTLDQEQVTIPNSLLAKSQIVTYTKPSLLARQTLFVQAPYRIPPEQVRTAILGVLQDIPEICTDPPPVVATSDFLENATIRYAIRYFITNFGRREVIASSVRDRVWYALDRAAIELPLPMTGIELRRPPSLEETRQQDVDASERLLAVIPLLACLSKSERLVAANGMRLLRYAPGEAIFRQGEVGEALFILERGEVSIEIDGIEIGHMQAPDCFGEMALMTGEPRSGTIRAVGEVTVRTIHRDVFSHLLRTNPRLAKAFSQILVERLEARRLGLEAARSAAVPDLATDQKSTQLLAQIKRLFALE